MVCRCDTQDAEAQAKGRPDTAMLYCNGFGTFAGPSIEAGEGAR